MMKITRRLERKYKSHLTIQEVTAQQTKQSVHFHGIGHLIKINNFYLKYVFGEVSSGERR
jgi:hypothetical protein